MKISKAPWIGRFLRILLLLYLAVTLAWITFAYIQRQALVRDERTRDMSAVELAARTITNTLKNVRGDALILAKSATVSAFMAAPTPASRDAMEHSFVRMAQVRNGLYMQVRLLGSDGRERARVDMTGDKVSVVAQNALQDKSGRYYVKAVAALKPGQVYVSPLDLNVEHGKIEQPWVPTLRVGTGVFDASGARIGMIIINVQGDAILQIVQHDQRLAASPLWLLDREGHWLIGPNPEDDWSAIRHPETPTGIAVDRPKVWHAMQGAAQGQMSEAFGTLSFAGVDLDGTGEGSVTPMLRVASLLPMPPLPWLPIERYWALYLLVLSMLVGVAAWIARQQDLLHRERMQTKANSHLLNDIFVHSPLMMKVKDLDRRILRVNEAGARMIGCPIDNLRGCTVSTFATPESADLIAAHDDEVIASKRVSQYEEQVDYVGGSYTLLTTRFPVTDESGKVVGVGAVCADITERKRFEESLQLAKVQAESANRAKSAFLANMSHELRTPLNSIIGLSELLMEDLQDARLEQHTEPLRRVIQAGRHLLYLINDLLDLARVESGRIELMMEPCLVQEVADAVEGSIRPLASANDNELMVDVAENVRWVHADPQRLKQVLINLLGNAAKFTRHGHVQLHAQTSTAGPEGWVEFVVDDDGIGIGPQQLEHIFEPFKQGDATIGRRYGGTGLGLTITRQLVELMGGEISVDSVLGKGSTFTVRLPAARPSEHDRLSDTASRENHRAGSDSAMVIVVDDDADAREVIAATLEREGLRVVTAANGADALELATHQDAALMVLDIGLPDMSGWDVLTRLRADPRHAQLPVILCTISDVDRRMMSLGVAEHFAKPVDRERLRAVVRRLTASKEAAVIGVVDDDADYRKVLTDTLRRGGYEVIEASSGPAIIEQLHHRHCDLLLLDVVMPGMDGIEVAERLRADPVTTDVEVVLITAADLPSHVAERIHGRAVTLVRKQAESPQAIAEHARAMLMKLRAGALTTEPVQKESS